MTVVVGHNSAWQYWLHTGVTNDDNSRTGLLPLPKHDESCDYIIIQHKPCIDALTKSELSSLNMPINGLHVIVESPRLRRRTNDLHCHSHSACVPSESILRISEHVYISSPEYLFFQKAIDRNYSLERLILLGYGICGRFAFAKNQHGEDELVQVFERSSIEKLTSFLDEVESMNSHAACNPMGILRARKALQHILGVTESPQEAKIAMLEFMDARFGGNAVLSPECNGSVVLAPDQMKATNRKSFRCDFLWRKQRVVLEYNGTHHGNPREVTRDAEKYNALRSAGYEVILAAREHVNDPAHTDALAEQLRRALGQRRLRVRYDHNERKMHLRKEIGLL